MFGDARVHRTDDDPRRVQALLEILRRLDYLLELHDLLAHVLAGLVRQDSHLPAGVVVAHAEGGDARHEVHLGHPGLALIGGQKCLQGIILVTHLTVCHALPVIGHPQPVVVLDHVFEHIERLFRLTLIDVLSDALQLLLQLLNVLLWQRAGCSSHSSRDRQDGYPERDDTSRHWIHGWLLPSVGSRWQERCQLYDMRSTLRQ